MDIAEIERGWHVAALNDGLFIIDKAPPAVPGMVLNVVDLPLDKAQVVIDAHNATILSLTQALRESMEREAGLRESFDDAKGLLREHLSVFGHPGFTDRGSYADGIRAFFKRTALRTGGGE